MNLASLDIYHTLYLSEMHQTEKRMPTQAKGKDFFFFFFLFWQSKTFTK